MISEPVSREAWQKSSNRLGAIVILVAAIVGNVLFLRSGGWGDAWGLSLTLKIGTAILADLVAGWCCLYVLFRPRQTIADHRLPNLVPPQLEDYCSAGLGPLPQTAGAKELYLDQVKRAVTNILYEDSPFWFYDHLKRPVLAGGFSLARRVRGEDSPTSAHTMVGLKRLDNLQHCVEQVLREKIPGDLIETGSYRGGATVFMRALLRAYGVQDRRVFVCDTFVPPSPPQPSVFIMPLIQALAAIPGKAWQRAYFLFLQRLPKHHQAFPDLANPSDDFVRFLMWNLRNPVAFNRVDNTGLAVVKSNFARYGLLDDQVVFLQGFFAETLPKAPIDTLAIVRLDGDTYESTWDAITQLYPKLSSGGYLIVDDYESFSDCRRAIEDYRSEHQIRDPIQPIDNLAVFWQKS